MGMKISIARCRPARVPPAEGHDDRELIAAIARRAHWKVPHSGGCRGEAGQSAAAQRSDPEGTGRAREIVHGKQQGISAELYISEATVKTHINSLLGKLGVTDRTQAATVAIERGIIPLGSSRGSAL